MQMTQEQMLEVIAKLKAENHRLSHATVKTEDNVSFRVSAKGAVSVYSLGRFPVTLYKEQWLKLLAKADALRKFIDDNDEVLSTKVREEKAPVENTASAVLAGDAAF